MSGQSEGPVAFGFKTAWYAVRSTSAKAVADALPLRRARSVSWHEGVEGSHAGGVFVAPPVDGWVLVVSAPFGESVEDANPWTLLLSLSKAFGEAQFFCTHRTVELHAWAKATESRVVRAYGYIGEQGETLFDEGPSTPEEQALGFRFFDERSSDAEHDAYWERTDLCFPDESSVMAIARAWSLAPVDLTALSAPPATGLLGALT